MRFILICALGLAACHTVPSETLPKRDTPVAAGTDDDCDQAGQRLRSLGCKEASPRGATFEEVCRNTEHTGYATMNPHCLAQVKSCDETNGC